LQLTVEAELSTTCGARFDYAQALLELGLLNDAPKR
jgi:hypothetical protein